MEPKSAFADARFVWRGPFANAEVNALHANAFEHALSDDDWLKVTDEHSLGWVTARNGDELVGFVNVIWDGSVHAWIQDAIVAPDAQRSGIGQRLIEISRDQAMDAGCGWLHVDFADHLRPFYHQTVGFVPTNGGLINLKEFGG